MVLYVGIFQTLSRAFGSRTTGIRSPWRKDGVLEQLTYAGLFGDVDGIAITRDRALSLPVISKARRVLVGTISRLPLVVSDKTGQPWEIQPPLTQQPEDGFPLSNTLAWTAEGLYFHGRAFWHVTDRDSYGWPRRVELVAESDAQTNDRGQLIGIGDRKVNPTDTIRFDSIDGGLLSEASNTMRRAIVLNTVAALSEANPVPTVELHQTGGEKLNDEEIDTLIERFRSKRANGSIGYTSSQLEMKTHGARPEQLLIAGTRRIDMELARHAGIPAWAADVPMEGASLNYSNRASRNWELIDLFLAPYLTVIHDRLSLPDVTPRGSKVKFSFDELTRADMKERFETYKTGKDAGFIDNAWIAKQEGWPAPMGETPREED